MAIWTGIKWTETTWNTASLTLPRAASAGWRQASLRRRYPAEPCDAALLTQVMPLTQAMPPSMSPPSSPGNRSRKRATPAAGCTGSDQGTVAIPGQLGSSLNRDRLAR